MNELISQVAQRTGLTPEKARQLPSRLELKRRAGSFRDAPLEDVSFTIFL